MVKIVKFLVRIISEHLLKAIFLMFETETVRPCLVRNLKWGVGGGGEPPWGVSLEQNKRNLTLTLTLNLLLLLPSTVFCHKIFVFIMIFTALSFLRLIHGLFII